MTEQVVIDERLSRAAFEYAGRAKFRGGIYDNCRDAPMGKGYSNDGKPFDLETACYLKPVLAAIENESVRKVVIMKGVKTMGSFIVEMALGYYCAHGIGDCTLYFCTGEMSEDQSTTRILNYLWGIPSMAAKRKTMLGQWDETIGAIKFPDKTLRLKPANLANVQDVNLCFVGIRDAFLTEATGMIDQAIERTTQYPADKKIIIESQGGEEGFDFDRHYRDTDQGELHVICPVCGTPHIWNWRAWDMIRPGDFIAKPPLSVPSADRAAWVKHWTPILKGEDRRRCGFKRGDDDLIKLPDGQYNESEILRQTYFECYHCGGAWHDDGEFGATRIALDRSSHYVAARPDALPENKGFNFPKWINRRLPWGPMMLEKLNRQKALDEFGNIEPLKEWWQKTAARTWNPKPTGRETVLMVGSYETDPAKLMPDSHCRQMTVDCHKALTADKDSNLVGALWFEAREFDTHGNSIQLARGFLTSWDLLAANQRYWKIPNARVFVDWSWMPSQIEEAAVRHFELVPPLLEGGKPIVQTPSTWRMMQGSGSNRRLTINNKGVTYMVHGLPGTRTAHDRAGKLWRMQLRKITWSNLWFEKQLDAILQKRVSVKWEFLPLDKLVIVGLDGKPDAKLLQLTVDREKARGKFSNYSDQLDSRYYDERTNQYKDYEKQSRPTEYRDCALMHLVGVAQDGLLGHVAADGEDGNKDEG